MLKKILELASFSALLAEACEIAQAADQPSPLSAGARLQSWLPAALERCGTSAQGLELLNVINPGAQRIHQTFCRELLAQSDNPHRAAILASRAHSLSNSLRDTYFQHLHLSLSTLQKNGQLPLWIESLCYYLDWNANSFVLSFMAMPSPGCNWHKLYTLYAPLRRSLERAGAFHGGSRLDMLQLQLKNSLARLLLLAFTLNERMTTRQILIAADWTTRLHGHLQTADDFSRETPYGIDIHEDQPPILIRGDRPVPDAVRLFFGLNDTLDELVKWEHRLLSQPDLLGDLKIDATQTASETHAAIRYLRARWGGRQTDRGAERRPLQRTARLIHSHATIRGCLLGERFLRQGERSEECLCCEIADVSATGCGVLLDHKVAWASNGALVAIFPPESQDWTIATIRRVSLLPHDKLFLGLELLSAAPKPIELYEAPAPRDTAPANAGREGTASNALYLPASPCNAGQDGLLTEERRLMLGGTYRTCCDGETFWLNIREIAEIGSDYIQYTCVKTEAPTGLAPN